MNHNDVKQYNSTISIFRSLAAFFVLSQHVPYEGSLQFVDYFMCTAVPFFFLVAGYFSWNSSERERGSKIVKHLKKIVLVYCGAYLFYYMISVGLKYVMNGLFHKNIAIEFENWNLLQFGKGLLLDIDPFASHLWFLYSMVFIYMLLWVFHFQKLTIPGFVIAIGLFATAHTELGNGSTLATIRVAVTSSFSTAYIGYFTHYMEEKGWLLKKNLLTYILFGIGILYLVIELYFKNIFIHHGYTEYVALVAFLIAVKYKNIGEGTILDRIGRKYTLGIYVFHIFVMHMWERVVAKLSFVPFKLLREVNVIIVYVLSLLLVMLLLGSKKYVVKMKQKVKGK